MLELYTLYIRTLATAPFESALITSGTLQGSVLGPTLFDICFNDIRRTLRTSIALYMYARHGVLLLYSPPIHSIQNSSKTHRHFN